jgi:uncharacterized membrane protein
MNVRTEPGAWEASFAEATGATVEAAEEDVAGFEEATEEVDEVATEEAEEETEVEVSEASEEPPARGPGSGRRPGADEVLNYLQENYPEARDVVRNWQQTVSRNVNEYNELKAQMLDVINELREMKEQRNESEQADSSSREAPAAKGKAPNQAQKSYNQAQWDLVQSILQDAGVVTKSEVEEEREREETDNYVKQSLSEGLERYGEAFGRKEEDGSVVLNESLKADLQKVLERVEKQGLTPLDLALLSGRLTPAEASQERNGNRSNDQLRRANVVQANRSAPKSSRTSIRKKGDSSEDVFDRAFALARQELTQY